MMTTTEHIAERFKKRHLPGHVRHPETGRLVNTQELRFIHDEHQPLADRMTARERALLETVHVEMQGEVIKLKCHKPLDRPQAGSGRRAIQTFTPKARKNMLETVSRIDWTGKTAQFITLTYHSNQKDAQTAKRHLRAFLKRLYRRWGNTPALWKLEPQKRGAWHFHLLIWDLPYLKTKTILKHWRAVTGEDTITQVKIEPIQSARKARSYVAKYIGKIVTEHTLRIVLLLALACPAWMIIFAVLDYLPNQAANLFPGRFWGIENRFNLQWATLTYVSIALNPAFWDFKRAARRSWRGINGSRYQGFTLFARNPGRWFDYLFYLIGQEHQNANRSI